MTLNRYHLRMIRGWVWPIVAVAMVGLTACGNSKKDVDIEALVKNSKVKTTDIVEGTGRTAEEGDVAVVLYRGTFPDGEQFDTNMDDVENQVPFAFLIGGGMVIKGWEQGVVGMKEGGTRKLEIPWPLAYGLEGSDRIPPKSDLNFEIKLLYLLKKGEKGVYDVYDNKVGTGPEAKDGSTVEVHYVGTYLTGKVWDDTRKRGETVKFILNDDSEAIRGMVFGVKGMRVGGTRTLVLPPELVFGDMGSTAIQGGQPVKIVVDLISVDGKKS